MNMKKSFTWIALIIICFSFVVSNAFAESIKYTTEATITNQYSSSAKNWYSSKNNRAILTVLLSVDVFNDYKEKDSDAFQTIWTNTSIVGLSKSQEQLLVAGYYSTSESTTLIVMLYKPTTGKIDYMPIVITPSVSDDVAITMLEAAASSNSEGKYEKNDLDEVAKIVEQVFD